MNQTDNEKLIRFWNSVFVLDDEDLKDMPAEGWRELAPSEKLFDAAKELGKCKKVLDYGCGSGWAGIITAKSGCMDVTAADAAEEALRSTGQYASIYNVDQIIHTVKADNDWLRSIPDQTYDGLFCSNVLDVIPEETAISIIREFARIVTNDANVVIGMNYYMSEQEASDKGLELTDHKCLYIDGILRMVSRTDEEWTRIFSPYFTLTSLDHFAWDGEKTERRRLFHLKKANEK
ncbi:MAG: class I SAM-dependent methyltransferase [Solobacterium sp.]|nr:class I SAM-dependent methyltransferase [Solobacterium sp.]